MTDSNDWLLHTRLPHSIPMRPVTDEEISSGKLPLEVSISSSDIAAGSPKKGDMIARDPNSPDDQWLVSAEFYNKHYAEGEMYDSTADTLKHIKRVAGLLSHFSAELLRRGRRHDASKLQSPEKELFDRYTPMLRDTTYGSERYNELMGELSKALEHHYAHNSHHPEHYANGINGFDLFDLMEMFADWKAASERHKDGDLHRSIQVNTKRFDLSPQLVDILINTADSMIDY